jgi:hypothetical protein
MCTIFCACGFFTWELVEVKKDKPSTIYPRVALVYGEAPTQDSKEMDLFGTEFSEDEFKEVHGSDEDGEEEEDMFGESDEFFDPNDFDGSYSNGEEY